MDLTEQFNEVGEVERITVRECEGQQHEGIEYNLYGYYIPIRDVLDIVAETEDHYIESITHFNEEEAFLSVFVVEQSIESDTFI